MFVAGTDLSEVEVLVDGVQVPCKELTGHNSALPCSLLCEPLCNLLAAGKWRTIGCSEASYLGRTWPSLELYVDDAYFEDNAPMRTPFAIRDVTAEFVDELLGSWRLWSEQILKPDAPYHTWSAPKMAQTRTQLGSFCKSLDKLSESMTAPHTDTMADC